MNRTSHLALASAFAASLAACDDKKPPPQREPEPAPKEAVSATPVAKVDRALIAAYAALPARMAPAGKTLSDDAITLGKQLYFDARLSKSQEISCNSCHGLDTYGVDNKPTSPGHEGQLGGRNSPSVYNAALHTAQFWDGRAKDVEEQALGPILNPVEMAMKDEAAVLTVVRSIPEYVDGFKKAFPEDKEPVTYKNLGKAIGAFERTLVTPSGWDKYVAGDDEALTNDERAGLAKFLEVGCNTCHLGVDVGGQDFKKLGQAKPWPTPLKDNGRFDATKAEVDRYFFKVPSLRNVDKTAPYFHDGSIKTLDEAVKLMAFHQLGKELSAEEVTSIVTFLKSLTGELPKIDKPELPKSTAKTPKADPN